MFVKASRTERAAATRESLVAAARRLFGSRGSAATPRPAVGAPAGVTKGALYHHFDSKEDLFGAVAEGAKREVNSRLSSLFLDAEDPFSTITEGCHAILEAYLDPALRQIVWVDAGAVLPVQQYLALQSRAEEVFLRAALRRAMRIGMVANLPLRALTLMLTAAIAEGCAVVASAEDPAAALRDVHATLDRILVGLRA
jgi:AcrR family transcriptional regulator